MSFFMLRMPVPDLMFSPPLSKHTPLPTMATCGCDGVAPGQFDQARRAMRGAADRMDRRVVLREQVVAGDHVDAGAMGAGDLARHGFQGIRAHVLGGRVDQVAHPHAGGKHVEAGGIELAHQPRGRARRGLVTGKAITAQPPAQLQCFARIGRQRAGHLPVTDRQGQRRVRVGQRVQRIADADHGSGDAAFGIRPGGCAAGTGIELLRVQPGLHRGRLRVAPGRQAVALDDVQRARGGSITACCETSRQGHSVSSGLSGGAASSQSASAVRVVNSMSARGSCGGQAWSPRSIQQLRRPARAAPAISMCGWSPT